MILAPSTNNALESTNRVIKAEFTKRQRVSLSRCLTIMLDIVENNGVRYMNGLLKVAVQPSLTMKLWTAGRLQGTWQQQYLAHRSFCKWLFHLRQATPPSIPFRLHPIPFWLFPIKKTPFDSYMDTWFSSWTVILPAAKEKWIDGTCTCPSFHKVGICKHVIGLAIQNKHVKAPLKARSTIIGAKRPRGRRSKAKKAHFNFSINWNKRPLSNFLLKMDDVWIGKAIAILNIG